jgi:hypothetical protein
MKAQRLKETSATYVLDMLMTARPRANPVAEAATKLGQYNQRDPVPMMEKCRYRECMCEPGEWLEQRNVLTASDVNN